MKFCQTLAHATVALAFCASVHAEQRPILRVDADGPMSFGRAVAFDPTGTLYAGGWDQLVRAWTANAGNYALDPAKTIRVPIGPGLNGAINAMATSPDGRWIAIAGISVARGMAGFDVPGRIVPAKGNMTKAMRADQGTIYLVDKSSGEVHRLRGHLGEVLALQFAANGSQQLISAGVARFPANRDGQAVVRVWDVETRKYERGVYLDVAEGHVIDPPQLASVEQDGALRVAVAWNDGQLRWWDLSSATVSKYATGTPQTTKTVVLAGDRMVTGGNDSSTRRGNLTTWTWNGSAFQRGRQIDVQPAQGVVGVPQALNAVQYRGNDYLVAAVQAFAVQNGRAAPTHVELHMVHAETGRKLLRHRLWATRNGTVDVPSIAVSPDGQVIAVAGGAPGHGVQLFRVDDLARAVVKPLALQSRAASPSRVWFVRNDQRIGLGIKQGSSQRDFIFDAGAGRSIALENGWVLDQPAVSGWTVTQAAAQSRLQMRVRTPNGRSVSVPIPKEQEAVTAYALAPVTPLGMPLLAVASHYKGQPLLGLYDLRSGSQLRQFTGHTETIGSLAFSSDGRLLASTASDHTVRVWNTADLAETLGKHGMLRGVRVEMSDDGSLTVAESDEDGAVRVGDVLRGHGPPAELQTWSDPAAFYASWWNAEPGSTVSVHLSRNGGQQQTDVLVEQGIDERKPLFSLFLAENPGGLPRQWIGWSPLGLFESSDSEVERFLGWHFNTPDEPSPTRFAELSEYRDDFYRSGLLDYLLKHGTPPTEVPDQPPPPPDLSLTAYVDDAPVEPRRGEVMLRSPEDLGIVLSIDPRFPQQLIKSIDCQVNGKSLGQMQPSETGLQWGLDLSSLPLERGAYAVTTTLRTNESVPRRFRKSLRLRYQPPAPQLQITSQPGAISESQFQFAAQVVAGGGEPANVELYRRSAEGKSELVKSWPNVSGTQNLSAELSLDVGRHQLDLVAQNANANALSASHETTERSLILERAAAVIKPPQLALRAEIDGEDSPLEEGQFVYVEAPKLEVQGTVASDAPVQTLTARWEVADGKTGQAKIEMGSSARRFRYQLPRLLPGDTQVWVTVTAESGAKAESYFQVNYQPPMPVATITSPSNATDLWIRKGETKTVALEASLLLPDDPDARQDVKAALQGHISVNGNRISQPIAIDVDKGIVSGEVPLGAGENVIELHLQQGPIRHSDEVVVTCYDELTGEVAQPEQRSGTVRLVGIPRGLEPTVVENSETGERLRWRRREDGGVEVVPVAGLSEGFVARVRFSRLPSADFKVPAQDIPRKAPPPSVTFVQPTLDEQVLQPISVLEFSVSSETEVSDVELWQSTKHGKTKIPLDNTTASKRDDGTFVVQNRVNVRLAPGLNSMDVFATNQAGEVSRSRYITYIEPPAIVQIESLQTEDGTVIQNRSEIGQPRFDEPSPRAFVTLKGHIKLKDEDDARWKSGRHYVHVWVNGFQQLPARLSLQRQQGESTLRFETPVLLGQADNLVQLSVPGLPRESRQQVVPIRCSQPLQDQRLHLLVIGVLPESNGPRLLNGALSTLRLEQYGVKLKSASPRLVERYATKPNASGAKHVFREVFVYRPLTGSSANNRMISGHLGLVHRTIVELNAQRMKKANRASDVVVVYYAGTERVRNDGYFHLATATKNQFLRSDLLSRFVHNTLGAHLLLLDVNRPVVTGGPLPHAAGISVLRLAQPQTHTMMTQLLADARPAILEQFNTELHSRVRSIPGYPASAQYDGLIPQTMEKLQLAPD